MTETTMAKPPESLREEDLVPGRPWVHPETRLEYEDFHAFFCGKDPIPHWRNARIKAVLAGEFDRFRDAENLFGRGETREQQRARLIAHYIDDYDRFGNLAAYASSA